MQITIQETDADQPIPCCSKEIRSELKGVSIIENEIAASKYQSQRPTSLSTHQTVAAVMQLADNAPRKEQEIDKNIDETHMRKEPCVPRSIPTMTAFAQPFGRNRETVETKQVRRDGIFAVPCQPLPVSRKSIEKEREAETLEREERTLASTNCISYSKKNGTANPSPRITMSNMSSLVVRSAQTVQVKLNVPRIGKAAIQASNLVRDREAQAKRNSKEITMSLQAVTSQSFSRPADHASTLPANPPLEGNGNRNTSQLVEVHQTPQLPSGLNSPGNANLTVTVPETNAIPQTDMIDHETTLEVLPVRKLPLSKNSRYSRGATFVAMALNSGKGTYVPARNDDSKQANQSPSAPTATSSKLTAEDSQVLSPLAPTATGVTRHDSSNVNNLQEDAQNSDPNGSLSSTSQKHTINHAFSPVDAADITRSDDAKDTENDCNFDLSHKITSSRLQNSKSDIWPEAEKMNGCGYPSPIHSLLNDENDHHAGQANPATTTKPLPHDSPRLQTSLVTEDISKATFPPNALTAAVPCDRNLAAHETHDSIEGVSINPSNTSSVYATTNGEESASTTDIVDGVDVSGIMSFSGATSTILASTSRKLSPNTNVISQSVDMCYEECHTSDMNPEKVGQSVPSLKELAKKAELNRTNIATVSSENVLKKILPSKKGHKRSKRKRQIKIATKTATTDKSVQVKFNTAPLSLETYKRKNLEVASADSTCSLSTATVASQPTISEHMPEEVTSRAREKLQGRAIPSSSKVLLTKSDEDTINDEALNISQPTSECQSESVLETSKVCDNGRGQSFTRMVTRSMIRRILPQKKEDFFLKGCINKKARADLGNKVVQIGKEIPLQIYMKAKNRKRLLQGRTSPPISLPDSLAAACNSDLDDFRPLEYHGSIISARHDPGTGVDVLLDCKFEDCREPMQFACWQDNEFRLHMLLVHDMHFGDNLFMEYTFRSSVVRDCRNCNFSFALAFEAHRRQCSPSVPLEEAFRPCVIDENQVTRHRCGLCDHSCAKGFELLAHVQTQHLETLPKLIFYPKFYCAICLRLFIDTENLMSHASTCVQRPTRAEIMELARSYVWCQLCKMTHPSCVDTFHCYRLKALFRCVVCTAVYKTNSEFYHHLATYHKLDQTNHILPCPFCSTVPTLYLYEDFEMHVIDVHYAPLLRQHTPVVREPEEDSNVSVEYKVDLRNSDIHYPEIGISATVQTTAKPADKSGPFLNEVNASSSTSLQEPEPASIGNFQLARGVDIFPVQTQFQLQNYQTSPITTTVNPAVTMRVIERPASASNPDLASQSQSHNVHSSPTRLSVGQQLHLESAGKTRRKRTLSGERTATNDSGFSAQSPLTTSPIRLSVGQELYLERATNTRNGPIPCAKRAAINHQEFSIPQLPLSPKSRKDASSKVVGNLQSNSNQRIIKLNNDTGYMTLTTRNATCAQGLTTARINEPTPNYKQIYAPNLDQLIIEEVQDPPPATTYSQTSYNRISKVGVGSSPFRKKLLSTSSTPAQSGPSTSVGPLPQRRSVGVSPDGPVISPSTALSGSSRILPNSGVSPGRPATPASTMPPSVQTQPRSSVHLCHIPHGTSISRILQPQVDNSTAESYETISVESEDSL